MTILLAAAASTLVFCAPGYPGGAGDAQPLVDRFAAAVVTTAGLPSGSLAAVYDPTEQGGLAKLAASDAALAFVPYPFFVEHAAKLHLNPIAQADVTDVGTQEKWSLVAKNGRVNGAPSLAGFTLVSVAGYAPQFVRNEALAAWPLPPTVRIEATGQILSALRRISAGESVVALLDRTQTTALATLPFGTQLQTVAESPPLPVALMTVVDDRLPASQAHALQSALLRMNQNSANADAMGALHLRGFVASTLPAGPKH